MLKKELEEKVKELKAEVKRLEAENADLLAVAGSPEKPEKPKNPESLLQLSKVGIAVARICSTRRRKALRKHLGEGLVAALPGSWKWLKA